VAAVITRLANITGPSSDRSGASHRFRFASYANSGELRTSEISQRGSQLPVSPVAFRPPPLPTFVSPRGPVLGTRAYKACSRRFGGSLGPPAPSLASTCPRPPRRSRPLQPAVADRRDENPRSHSGKLGSCADKNQAAATANPTERKRKLPQSRTRFDPLPNSAVTPSKPTAPAAAKPSTAPGRRRTSAAGSVARRRGRAPFP